MRCGPPAEVNAALADLDEPSRRLFLARYRDQHTYRELADRTGSTPDAIAVRLHRARRRILASRRHRHDGSPVLV